MDVRIPKTVTICAFSKPLPPSPEGGGIKAAIRARVEHSKFVVSLNQIIPLYTLVRSHFFDEHVSIQNGNTKNTYKYNISNHSKFAPINVSNDI
jgi:hypothetical protein